MRSFASIHILLDKIEMADKFTSIRSLLTYLEPSQYRRVLRSPALKCGMVATSRQVFPMGA